MNARVLFVDDEPLVLQGIRRSLYVQRVDWKTAFATGGGQALELLSTHAFDAVVTDMHMAPMDGAELLEQVRERWPSTLRIVLSGHVEAKAAVRALGCASQFLSKPCQPQALVEAVESGIAVRALLADARVRDLVGRLTSLPAAPRVHAELGAALLDPQCDASRIAAVLARDPALSAKVLHLANSCFFSAARPAADLQTAVARIGSAGLGDLVLATEVFDPAVHGTGADRLRETGLRASRIASRIAAGTPDAAVAATAALLADIGYLLPGVAAFEAAGTLGEPAHAEIGAYLLALWSLPMPIVEAVAHHHAPARAPRRGFGAHGAVHVACAIAGGVEPDHAFLAACGVEGELERWRSFADATDVARVR